jgi:hypothetical protein
VWLYFNWCYLWYLLVIGTQNGRVEYLDSDWTENYECVSELEKEGFNDLKVNHRYNFVDPGSGAHTQTIERLWESTKWRNKKQRCTARHHLDSYLTEFMCQSTNDNGDIFKTIPKSISEFWPPETNYNNN